MWLGSPASLHASDRFSPNRCDARSHSVIAVTLVDELSRLIYELLDAHDDTSRIAAELVIDPVWSAHLEYLRDLQRVGRRVLAMAATHEPDLL